MSALWLIAVVVMGTPTGAVWEELATSSRPLAQGVEDLDAAIWFEGDPATTVLLELAAGEAPAVWRVDVDDANQAISAVEHWPVPVGDGRYLIAASAAPASPWAVEVPDGVSARVYRLRPTERTGWSSVRELRIGSAGQSWTWSLRGPGRLVVQVRAVRGDPLRATPFDLVVQGPDSSARLFSSSSAHKDAPWRRLEAVAGPGSGTWEARATGAELELRARLVRTRPPFPRVRSTFESTPLDADLQAWIEMAQDQSRAAPAEGELAALPALEAAVTRLDGRGPTPAPRELRDAARHAWLQATAYLATGVHPPDDAVEVLAILPGTSQGPDDRGRYPLGMTGFLPDGDEVEIQAPPSPCDADRWAVIRGLGVNTSNRPLVASLGVDGAPPTRVLIVPGWTPFRLAVPPGDHTLRLRLPTGAGDVAGLAVDLPTPVSATSLGGTHARLVRAALLDAEGATGRFGLPPETTHMRVDAWWSGAGPRRLRVRTAGGQRTVVVYPGEDVPVLLVEPARLLTPGNAAVDLPDSTSWVSVELADDDGPVWVRVTTRQPYPRTVNDAGVGPPLRSSGGGEDLTSSSLRVLENRGAPQEEALARLARARALLALGLAGYARRDIEAAAELDAQHVDEVDRLRLECRAAADHVAVLQPPVGPALPLDLPAAVGQGPPAWVDALDDDDPAVAVARGRLDALDDSPAAHLALAQRARGAALDEPHAALLALAHARLAGEVVVEASAGRIAGEAMTATRPDPLGIASSSPQRVILASRVEAPDPDVDIAGWARWTLLGAPLSRVDRVVAAGSQWVIEPGRQGGAEITLEAFCDDLRHPVSAEPVCHAAVRVGRGDEQAWEIPVGEVATRTLRVGAGDEVAVALAAGGHARHMALGLDGHGWALPGRRAAFHVAWPDQPVIYRVVGPTVLEVETAPLCGHPPQVQLVVDGVERAGERWSETRPDLVSDAGESFGPSRQHHIVLLHDDVAELLVRAVEGRVAVRVTQRMAEGRIEPREALPGVVAAAAGATPATQGWADPANVDVALRLPQPRFGTVEAGAHLHQRWSADGERGNRRYLYGEIGALHRVGLARMTWLSGGVLARLGAGPPTVGVRLAATQRVPVAELRLRGRLQWLAQQGDGDLHSALALRLRLDRPLRLGPDVRLVPALTTRGYLQPPADAAWGDIPADLEIASSYRRSHPFGLGVDLDLVWRPWINGEITLGARARSNPDLSADHAGGRAELRVYLRPVGLTLGGDVTRRLADEWRHTAWWRTEFSLGAWADLGPPMVWIRPQLQLSYLVDPGRLALTLGVTVTPGRRAVTHFAPTELLFEDIREPQPRDGRWRR